MRIETIVALDREIDIIKKATADIAKTAQWHAENVLKWAMRAAEQAAQREERDAAEAAARLEDAADTMVKFLRAIAAGNSKIETIEHIKAVILKAQTE